MLAEMRFFKTVLTVFAGTATASVLFADLNSTGLGAVLAGAGPVITETITITEHLAVIPMRTHLYKWLNLPIRLTRVTTSSTIAGKQAGYDGIHRHLLHPPGTSLSPFPAITSSVIHSTPVLRIHRHKSTTVTSETAVSQLTTTGVISQASMDSKDLKPKLLHDMLPHGLERVKEALQTLISQPSTTSELPKSSEGMESRLQKKVVKGMSDLKITADIHTINPTWSLASKKWHGPHSHPGASVVASTSVKEKSVETVSITTEGVPVVTASAFKA